MLRVLRLAAGFFQIKNKYITVNVIKTLPDNIILTTQRQQNNIGEHYGINGGFFAPLSSDVPGPLCIAINNHIPVRNPELRGNATDAYQNTGWYNSWGNTGGAGTFVYDKSTEEIKFLNIKNGYELPKHVTDTSNYWAQGGIDFAIGKTNWIDIMRNQGLSNYLETVVTYRSAMGSKDGYIYLFTTEGESTLNDFRDAVIQCLGDSSNVILLDGYLCSQMRAIKDDGNVFDDSKDYHIEEVIALIDPEL